jgi:hypothetical protein
MAKMNRERAVKERRARKQEKKDEKKQAAADAAARAEAGETTFEDELVEGEARELGEDDGTTAPQENVPTAASTPRSS